ncbi:MAG: serine/threonine-protein phosphatase [Actinobacteria bacterium]|nr:serine/threonine-protein phosphatase [Actinomycetota bacterium]
MVSERRCPLCADRVDPRDRFCEECGARVADQRDRVEVDVGVAAGVSDRGRRHHRNEDALALRGLRSPRDSVTATVAVVCDGVSSVTYPDEAAEAAASAMVAALRADGDPSARGAPACTYVSAIITGGVVTVGWVGDSRAYWIPQTRTEAVPPVRLTEDDSWLAEGLAAGTLTLAEAATDRRAHAITAWLGQDADKVAPHVVTVEPEVPGVVVVCTDGLWNYLDSVDELAAALPVEALDAPLHAARELVEVALHRGGRDNITVAVLPFDTQPLDTQPGGAS